MQAVLLPDNGRRGREIDAALRTDRFTGTAANTGVCDTIPFRFGGRLPERKGKPLDGLFREVEPLTSSLMQLPYGERPLRFGGRIDFLHIGVLFKDFS